MCLACVIQNGDCSVCSGAVSSLHRMSGWSKYMTDGNGSNYAP